MLRNSQHHYGSISKFFHWIIALLVIGLLIVGLTMEDLPESIRYTVYDIHKATGLLVLSLMILRLCWTLSSQRPKLPKSVSSLERIAARSLQHSFYIVLILMPLFGWFSSTAAGYIPQIGSIQLPMPGVTENKYWAEIAEEAHEITGWIIIGMLSLHVLASLKHHLIDKNNVLRKMLPFVK